jgi:hypothetical protein
MILISCLITGIIQVYDQAREDTSLGFTFHPFIIQIDRGYQNIDERLKMLERT